MKTRWKRNSTCTDIKASLLGPALVQHNLALAKKGQYTNANIEMDGGWFLSKMVTTCSRSFFRSMDDRSKSKQISLHEWN